MSPKIRDSEFEIDLEDERGEPAPTNLYLLPKLGGFCVSRRLSEFSGKPSKILANYSFQSQEQLQESTKKISVKSYISEKYGFAKSKANTNKE